MRLALRGNGFVEWVALRAGLVPTPAAEAWGGLALAGVLVAAARSGLTDRLAAGPATADELAAELGLEPEATRLMLDCLRSIGHVTHRAGRYRLGRRSRRWLDPASRLSVARFVESNGDYWDWWARLPEVVRTGEPVGHHGAPPDDPYWRRYVNGQFELARLSAAEVAARLRLAPGPRRALDIGGGHGWYSAQLCRRYPDLTATVLDLPGSARIGRELIARAGLSDRVHHVEGDALTADLGGPYDLVMCFNLVHHLGPEGIVGLFAKVRRSLTPDGQFAVLDAFGDPARRRSAAGTFLGMFLYLSSGARLYRPDELRAWLSATGFGPPRRVPVRRIPGEALFVTRPVTPVASH
jgi:SAM-dependent methyltransferase